MHRAWKPWLQPGSTRTRSPGANSARQMVHSVEPHTASSVSAEYAIVGSARMAAPAPPFPPLLPGARRGRFDDPGGLLVLAVARAPGDAERAPDERVEQERHDERAEEQRQDRDHRRVQRAEG